MRLLSLSLLVALPVTLSAQAPATLTALLGVDTVSVEKMVRNGNTLVAEVLTRSPRTTLQRHRAQFDAAGNLTALTVREINPATGAEERITTYTKRGDSLAIALASNPQGERVIAAPADWLPFIDLVHWPFEVALQRMRRNNQTQYAAPMLTGQRISAFPLALIGRDSATVTHPTRGTMRLTVLADGSIRTLDAGATTRALIVLRRGDSDVDALARDFAARDAAGRGIGELSGRGGGASTVLGATITLDYGVPMKRGREIWGALVRYGQLWRTGANRATHFKTDRELRFGDLVVPAGEYTLYSIPDANGGTLIINRQTGQNGQQYNQARDLGRIPLRARALDREVEAFTISVREENGRGILALQWDRTELITEFTVTR
ncbi:MAG: hypothetical protein C0503_00230 [Gemmatimonas sp.]|nr:hypothetical protein [Gemmatimonas sp.]